MVFGGDVFETFLEGSVDYVIYRVYVVNQCFFIYCGLQICSGKKGGNVKVLWLLTVPFRFSSYIPLCET